MIEYANPGGLFYPGLLIEIRPVGGEEAYDSEKLLTAISIGSVGITTRSNATVSSVWPTALMSFFTRAILDVSAFCPILVA